MARRIELEIVGNDRSAQRMFRDVGRGARGLSFSIGTLAKSAAVIGGISAAVGGVGLAVRSAVDEFSGMTTVAAQTEAVLKSTGGVANVTADHVDKLASSIEDYSGRDDEAVKAGENLLLTFKNIRNEVGKGNAIFDRATKAAVDLSQAGFGDLTTASKQLGKALNDPVKGITALNRAGVTFTQQQKDQIKALVESGKTLEAQKIILREVESQVSGSARAFGETLPGQLSKLRESVRNSLGSAIGLIAPFAADALGAFNDFLGDLGRAKTVRAKIAVIWDGAKDAAAGARRALGDAISNVDFDAIWERARGISDGLQKKLEETDFSAVGKRIGDAFADAIKVAIPAAKDLASRITEAVRTIDWEQLGRAIGPGLATAVTTAFLALLDPAFWARNWDLALAVGLTAFGGSIGRIAGRFGGLFVDTIATGLARLSPRLGAAFRGLAIQAVRSFGVIGGLVARALQPITGIVSRVFTRLGRIAQFTVRVLGITAAINVVTNFVREVADLFGRVAGTIGNALDAAWEKLKVGAIKAALAVVEPFTHIPGAAGKWARDLKDDWNRQLDGISAQAKQVSSDVQASLDSIESRRVEVAIDVTTNTVGARPDEGTRGTQPVDVDQIAKVAGLRANAMAKAVREIAAEQSAKEAAAARDAASSRKRAADAAKAAAAAAKTARDNQRKAFETLFEGLDVNFDTAVFRGNSQKALNDLAAQEKAVRDQIRVEGRTSDLEQRLLTIATKRKEIRDQIAEKRRDASQRKQFQALGLSATGDEKIPTVANLQQQLSQLTSRLSGADKLTPKLKSQLAGVRKVLAGEFGRATTESRSKILELFKTIRSTFDQQTSQGPLIAPGRNAFNSPTFLDNVGLSPSQIRKLNARFSSLSLAGATLPTTPTANAVAGAGGGDTIQVNSTVMLDNDVLGRAVTRHQTARKRRNPPQKRGPNAGRF